MLARTSTSLSARRTLPAGDRSARRATAPGVGLDPSAKGRRIGPGSVALLLALCGGLAGLGFGVSLPLAGILYVALVIAGAIVRPDLIFLLVFLEAPFVYDLGGGPVRVALADATLFAATPVFLFRLLTSGRPLARNPMFWPTAAYFAVCIASAAVTGGSGEAVTSVLQMALYMLLAVYVYANAIDGPGQVIPAFYALLLSNLVIAGAELAIRSNFVLGLHKNATGAELSYAVTIAVELWLARAAARQPRRLLTLVLLGLIAGLVNSLSRGAWLGTIVGVLVLLLLRRQTKLAIRSLIVMSPAIVVCWALLPKASREYAVDFGPGARNIEARYTSLYYAWDLFRDHPILGVGVGLRKTYDATNLVLATMAETGVLGIVTFTAVFVAFGWMVMRTRRRLSTTDPAFSLVAIGAALMAGKLAHGCVDHYWSRVMLPVWAAAGMAVFAYNRVRLGARPANGPVGRNGGPNRGAAGGAAPMRAYRAG